MSIVKKYKSEVVDIISPIDNIYTVSFRCIDRRFKYNPGQFLHLAIDEYDGIGQWPESRCFSMQSSPSDDLIKITYSVKGYFTQQMADQLAVGSNVWLKLPYGNLFSQEHDKSNCVFIAGGTGITPFLSLFTDPNFSDYSNPKLYFGFRDKNFDLYDIDLTKAKEFNSGLSIIKRDQSTDGFLNISDIIHTNTNSATYFISGPQSMIAVFKKTLTEYGVCTNNILTDDWE